MRTPKDIRPKVVFCLAELLLKHHGAVPSGDEARCDCSLQGNNNGDKTAGARWNDLLKIALSQEKLVFTNQCKHIVNRPILILPSLHEFNSVRVSPGNAVFLSPSLTTLVYSPLRNSSSFPRTRPPRLRDLAFRKSM